MSHREWRFRLWPGEDELLSSYLARSAHAHGLTGYRFCSLMWPQRAVWNRDIDRYVDPEWLNDISHKCGIPTSHLRSMTLLPYLDTISPQRTTCNAYSPFVLNIGVYHRKRFLYGQQYCTLCFIERGAYLKRQWRLGFAFHCEVHGSMLRDACPSCDAPVMAHRAGLNDLHRCAVCGRRLEYDVTPSASLTRVSDAMTLQLEQTVTRGIETGSVWLGDLLSISEAILGLRALISVATRNPQYFAALREGFGLPGHSLRGHPAVFEHLRIEDRQAVMQTIAHWTEDWPRSFLLGVMACGATQRTFAKLNVPPFLARAVERIPSGTECTCSSEPAIHDASLRLLRRRDMVAYRKARASRLLDLARQQLRARKGRR